MGIIRVTALLGLASVLLMARPAMAVSLNQPVDSGQDSQGVSPGLISQLEGRVRETRSRFESLPDGQTEEQEKKVEDLEYRVGELHANVTPEAVAGIESQIRAVEESMVAGSGAPDAPAQPSDTAIRSQSAGHGPTLQPSSARMPGAPRTQ